MKHNWYRPTQQARQHLEDAQEACSENPNCITRQQVLHCEWALRRALARYGEYGRAPLPSTEPRYEA